MGKSPASRVFLHVWTKVLNEYMREFNYMANCANLSMNVTPMLDHIGLDWSGFNDSMLVYIQESINQIVQIKGQEQLEDIFNEVKNKLLMDWGNFYFEQSYQQAFTLFDNATVSNSFELSKLRSHLEEYSYSDF